MSSEILAEYESHHSVYDDLRTTCENLVRQILRADGLSVHTVESRLKSKRSLAEKLQRPGKTYQSFAEVTDVAGLRVITFFEDDVDRVGGVIEREFTVDRDRSIDKRKSWGSDRFGYMSLHFVVSLSEQRANLIEYRRFQNLLCEIQVRSILQHTWAEIEHDLGYKASSNVPDLIRRRFSQLSSLLEMADREFCGIRDDLSKYLEETRSKVIRTPGEVELDDVTIRALVEEDSVVRGMDEAIANSSSRTLRENRASYPYLVRALRSVGFSNVGDVQVKLKANAEMIQKVAVTMLGREKTAGLARGISLWYVYMTSLTEQSRDIAFLVESFNQNSIFGAEQRKEYAHDLLGATAAQL